MDDAALAVVRSDRTASAARAQRHPTRGTRHAGRERPSGSHIALRPGGSLTPPAPSRPSSARGRCHRRAPRGRDPPRPLSARQIVTSRTSSLKGMDLIARVARGWRGPKQGGRYGFLPWAPPSAPSHVGTRAAVSLWRRRPFSRGYLMYSVTATGTKLRTLRRSRSAGVKVHFDSSVM
jgi:hypothetical protein